MFGATLAAVLVGVLSEDALGPMSQGIIGLGGLGQIGARVAVLAGADVYVAEVNERSPRRGSVKGEVYSLISG